MDASDTLEFPDYILFPSGLLFPCNTRPLLSLVYGQNIESVKKILLGAYILNSEFILTEIVKVSVVDHTASCFDMLKNTLFRRMTFNVILEKPAVDEQEVIQKFQQAMLNSINVENNILLLSTDDFLSVDCPRDLYCAFKRPALAECLDTL